MERPPVFNRQCQADNRESSHPMRENDTAPIRPADIAVVLVLLTRLPIPALPDTAFARQARGTWAFPVAGVVVGGLAAAVAALALALGLGPMLAAGLALAAQVLLTGAMHEDGLADAADGLWGGQTPERRLEIMKDSRIGSYGVLALILGTGLRWAALTAVIGSFGVWVLPALGAVSRAGLPAMMAALPRARPGGVSDSVGQPPQGAAVLAAGLGLVCALPVLGLVPTLAAALAVWRVARLARARIGGQTGDILGAAQQMAELAALLALAALA